MKVSGEKIAKSVYLSVANNGLRILTDESPYVESVVVSIGVKAGSRNETSQNNGIAHFLEHMAFKGTTTRTARQISEEIENVGGYVNAYTSKERTVYYIKVLKEDLELAIDILADILQNSIIAEEELEKERGVIMQEYLSSVDTPSDIVFDFFSEAVFGTDTPLGRSIIGTKQNIKNMQRKHLKQFMGQFYFAKNMVAVASGNVRHEHFADLIQKKFNKLQANSMHAIDVQKSPYIGGGVVLKQKAGLSQMQFLLGFNDSVKFDIQNNIKHGAVSYILGGGMSSRLFQTIREELGLAYSVSAFREAYEDGGVFSIYADSAPKYLHKLVGGIKQVLESTICNITEEELHRTMHQQKASLLMKEESISERSARLLSNYLTFGRYVENKEYIDALESLTVTEASQILSNIVSNSSNNMTLVVYGDFGKKRSEVNHFLQDLTKENFVYNANNAKDSK